MNIHILAMTTCPPHGVRGWGGWGYGGGNDPCAGSETIRLNSLCIPQGGRGGRGGGVSGGLKSFCREKGGGTEKCLKTGRGIASFLDVIGRLRICKSHLGICNLLINYYTSTKF